MDVVVSATAKAACPRVSRGRNGLPGQGSHWSAGAQQDRPSQLRVGEVWCLRGADLGPWDGREWSFRPFVGTFNSGWSTFQSDIQSPLTRLDIRTYCTVNVTHYRYIPRKQKIINKRQRYKNLNGHVSNGCKALIDTPITFNVEKWTFKDLRTAVDNSNSGSLQVVGQPGPFQGV